MNRLAIVSTVLILSIFPAYSSATVMYDIYTSTVVGSNLLTGSIGFENLADDYVGAVSAADITKFEFDGTVLDNVSAPPPGDWQVQSLTGTIDVHNSSLLLVDLSALVFPPAIGQIVMNDVGTSSTGGFGYIFGLYGMPGEAYLRPHGSVPEPSALALLAIGMTGFGFAKRRKLES